MSPTVKEILKKNGPMLSSSIINELTKVGLSPAAARQRVSRAKAPVTRLGTMKFKNNALFYYLSEHYKSALYWERLQSELKLLPIYARILGALEARGGTLPLSLFDTFSGSPKSPVKGHPLSKTILERMAYHEIIKEFYDDSLGKVIQLNEKLGDAIEIGAIRARLLAESILLKAIKQWFRSIGLISYDAAKIRDGANPPVFGQFCWDLTAPSYVYPFRSHKPRNGKVMPGFIVCDVLLSNQVTIDEIKFHVDKCSILRAQKHIRPFMSILVTEGYKPEAFRERGKAGLILTTPKALLGEDIAEALRSLIDALTSKARQVSGESIHKLFSSLGKIEGAAQNLRGPLFELISGRLAFGEHGGDYDIGKQVIDPRTGERVEIDVFLMTKKDLWVIECKGKNPGGSVNESEVNDWLKRQVPRIKNWIRAQPRFSVKSISFELWCSGIFDPDALSLLKDAKKRTRQYNINWKNGTDILSMAGIQRDKHISLILKEQFLNHPLS